MIFHSDLSTRGHRAGQADEEPHNTLLISEIGKRRARGVRKRNRRDWTEERDVVEKKSHETDMRWYKAKTRDAETGNEAELGARLRGGAGERRKEERERGRERERER